MADNIIKIDINVNDSQAVRSLDAVISRLTELGNTAVALQGFGEAYIENAKIVKEFSDKLLGSRQASMAAWDAQQRLNAANKEGTSQMQILANAISQRATKAMNLLGRASMRANQALKKFEQNFRNLQNLLMGVGLSFLFTGMVIKRVAQQIIQSTLSFYRQVTEGNTEQAEGLTRLESAWQFLKFSIGDALTTAILPLIPSLVSLIETVSEWASEHPKLTAAIVGGTFAIGGFMMIVGQVALFAIGLIQVLTFMGIKFTALAATVSGVFSSALFVAIGTMLGVIGVILLLALVFEGSRKALKEMVGDIVNNLKYLAKFWMAIFKGDFPLALAYAGLAFQSFFKGLVNFSEMVLQVMVGIGMGIIKTILLPVLAVAKAIDAIAGTNYASSLYSSVNDLEKSLSGRLSSFFDTSGDIFGFEAKVAGLEAERRQAESTENKQETIINELNINGVGVGSMQDIYDEINRQSGPQLKVS